MKRSAFTLIEVLTAVAIIAILVGIVVVGFRSVRAGADERQTRTLFENLRGLITEFEATARRMDNLHDAFQSHPTPAQDPDKPLTAPPAKMSELQYTSPSNDNIAVYRTRMVMGVLRAIPNNRRSMEQMTADRLLTFPDVNPPAGDQSSIPVVKDAWGNPIIYVPGEWTDPATNTDYHRGLDGVRHAGVAGTRHIEAPDHRAFWASAGPDGRFDEGDDNLYSFEN
jgi:prepilin-type N-terminal cleavage/methylation domain-containing protein